MSIFLLVFRCTVQSASVVIGVVRQLVTYTVLMGQVAGHFNGHRGGKMTGHFLYLPLIFSGHLPDCLDINYTYLFCSLF